MTLLALHCIALLYIGQAKDASYWRNSACCSCALPQAYKDLTQVMANQADLTEIVHRLQVSKDCTGAAPAALPSVALLCTFVALATHIPCTAETFRACKTTRLPARALQQVRDPTKFFYCVQPLINVKGYGNGMKRLEHKARQRRKAATKAAEAAAAAVGAGEEESAASAVAEAGVSA